MGNIAIGVGIGVAAGNLLVHYDKSVYRKKISELDGLMKELSKHVTTLEGYKSKLRSVWQDDKVEDYIKIMEKQIKALKNAINRMKALKEYCNEVIDAYEKAASDATEKITHAKSVTDALGIGDD